MPKLILTTVGTSLLTNELKEFSKEINQNSNKKESECSPEFITKINDHKKALIERLKTVDETELKSASAELNALVSYYKGFANANKADMHYLVVTDTFVGETTYEILQSLLSKYFKSVQKVDLKNFSTKDKDSFSEGIKELIKWCAETLPGYKEKGYQIIFNLTGSFKAIIAYLNTIAMFYADKIIYIFETSRELIEIPRLPVKLDYDFLKKYKKELFLLEANKEISVTELAEIPEAFIDSDGKNVMLSVWGELVWNSKKYELAKELIDFPYIKYEQMFIDRFKEMVDLQEKCTLLSKFAKISRLLSENNGDVASLKKDGGLQYEKFDNVPYCTMRINQGLRISCEKKSDGLYIRKYDKEPVVNKNL